MNLKALNLDQALLSQSHGQMGPVTCRPGQSAFGLTSCYVHQSCEGTAKLLQGN